MRKQRFFISQVTAAGCNLKNDLGRALLEYVRQKYEYTLLEGDDALTQFRQDITEHFYFMQPLYPRIKQVLADLPSDLGIYGEGYQQSVFHIHVRWLDKNLSTMFFITIIKVKEVAEP